jgi:hypothetical protein
VVDFCAAPRVVDFCAAPRVVDFCAAPRVVPSHRKNRQFRSKPELAIF